MNLIDPFIIIPLIFAIIYRHTSIVDFIISVTLFCFASKYIPFIQSIIGDPIEVVCYAVISWFIFVPLIWILKGNPKD